MIIAPEKSEVRGTELRLEFQVDPPAHNPLVPGAPVLFKREEGQDITIEWPSDSESPQILGSDQMADEIVNRSQRDAAKHPQSPRTLTNLGLAFLNVGKSDDAISSFRQALQLDPQNYVAATNLAKVLVNRGNYAEAEQLYRELTAKFPSSATPLMSLAYLHMRRRDFTAAERIIREVIRSGTQSAVPHYQLAIVLILSGRVKEAIGELRKAIRSDVRSPALYQALGVAYALAGDTAKSTRSFQSALTLAPDLSDAVRGLASTWLNVGNADATIELLESYLESKPEDVQARIILGRGYATKHKYQLARAHFLRAFGETETNASLQRFRPQLANDIGASLFFERDLKQAAQWFNKSVEVAPRRSPLPYRNLARTYIDLDQYESALDVLRRCKNFFGEDKETVSLTANVYSGMGAYDKAVAELTPLLSRDDADVDVFASLGTCLTDGLHDASGALEVFRRGYEKFPNNLTMINNLAYAYLIEGNISSARELLSRHHTQPGTNVWLTATWGLLYLKEGNLEKARSLYSEAAKLASLEGNRRLVEEVRQKLHLEMASALLMAGDISGALNEVLLGLKAGRGRPAYLNDLLAMKFKIEKQSAG